MSLSLSLFDTVKQSNDGATLHILSPLTGGLCYSDVAEKKPLLIHLLGAHSKGFDEARVNKKRELRNSKASKNKMPTQSDADKEIQEAAELYAKLTTGWENIPDFSGKGNLEFNHDNAVKLYINYMEIRVQVGNFVGQNVNFIQS